MKRGRGIYVQGIQPNVPAHTTLVDLYPLEPFCLTMTSPIDSLNTSAYSYLRIRINTHVNVGQDVSNVFMQKYAHICSKVQK